MIEPCLDLVIGIGNPLRGDDGVGWVLAQQAEALSPPPLVRCVQQLTPELSLALAEARRVLFLDAWLPGAQISIEGRSPQPVLIPLKPASAAGGVAAGVGGFSHVLDPAQLLAITALLHGRVPQAWQLLVPAYCLDHRDGLSPEMGLLLPGATSLLSSWCQRSQGRVKVPIADASPGSAPGRRPVRHA